MASASAASSATSATDALPPLWEPEGKRTPLSTSWAFWCQKKGKKFQQSNWYEGTQCIGRFSSVEGFWQVRGKPRRRRLRLGPSLLLLLLLRHRRCHYRRVIALGTRR